MNTMLSINEVRNAIYLDFEGEGKKADGLVPQPHMAGLFRPNPAGKGGQYACVFFKKEWKPAFNGCSAAVACSSFDDFFAEILQELETRDCKLLYWTMHEAVILEKYLDHKLYSKLIPRLYNLHPIAKKYANKKRLFGNQDTASKHPLEDFFAVMHEKRNPHPPFPLGAAEACRRIDTACSKHRKWSHFSDKQKAYVNELVAYNTGDCRSTWLIAKRLGNAYAKF
jgi:hypothetical protein